MRSLRPYQVESRDFLIHNPYAGLFADMGLGKTAATLHALVHFPKPILLVGPIRVIENVWRAEAELWPETQGLTFSLVRGSPKARSRALASESDIYLVNPEMLEDVLKGPRKFKSLVIDESSMFKNPGTKRFKVMRKARKGFERVVILTGTPSPNSLMDLWSQIFLLDGGQRLESSFFRFRDRYFAQTDYMGYTFEARPGAKERITELISDLVFRVEAKGNLPPREVIENKVVVGLPPKARTAYDQMEKDAFTKINQGEVTAATAAAVLTKLRQMASGFVYGEDRVVEEVHREKIQALKSILEETQTPVIVVYHFQHELEALRQAFPQGVGLEDMPMEDWNAGKFPLLFLHPQSGGHGLNLQYGSHTMAIFSASFSYEHMAQTKARIDRQGQESPVVFHSLVAAGTVDELLLEVLMRKEQTQASVLSMVKDYANRRGKN